MLTASQLVTYALQIVKAPGYTVQAGDLLNARLSSLARRYDFDVLKASTLINAQAGTQVYLLPTNYIRGHQVYYYIGGLPQMISQISLTDYNAINAGSLTMAYPTQWASDPSTSPPTLYLYPMPNTSFPVSVSYWSQPPDIATPATSNVVPWFPDSDYLLTALSADLAKITDDVRAPQLHREAMQALQSFLKMQGDREGYAQTVKRGNSFKGPSSKLPPSKITGF